MVPLTRRSLLRRSAGLIAAGALAHPHIADAQATTASVWTGQGLIHTEDAAFRRMVAGYEKASGNKIDVSILPFSSLRQKTVSALTGGFVPDLIYATPPEIVPEQAWIDKLVDVSDVVETQKHEYLPIALASAYFFNNVKKTRSYYGVPFEGAVIPFHIWGSLVEKAGFKISDIPARWDAFIDFFHPVQQKLRRLGMHHTYANGFVVSTSGNDPLNTFHAFMIAYGGEAIVTREGKLNVAAPRVREAVIRALDRFASLYKQGHIPPSSINWSDADDNAAFHSKQSIMDFDGTLSTELAMLRTPRGRNAYYHDVVTRGLPLSNEGKRLPPQFGVGNLMVPKGAKNVAVAKDYAKYVIQPEISNAYLKEGLGRWLPVMRSIVETDPWWTDPKLDPHRPPYVEEAFGGPTVPYYYVYNPAWAQIRTEHLFGVAFADIVNGGMTPAAAADKAFARMRTIFAKYPIERT